MTLVKEMPKQLAKPTNGTTQKAEIVTPPAVAFPEIKALPLEDRLHRLNQLFEMQQKYNRLQNSLQKLNEFELKKDGDRCNIRLQDDNRNEFSTGNPEIILEVTNFLKLKIKEKIKIIEPLLKW